jgi:hypothetical protein
MEAVSDELSNPRKAVRTAKTYHAQPVIKPLHQTN